jgi:hypothetical protein
MKPKEIFELKELALHQGLFVEGPVYEDGILVSFLDPIYVNETFIARMDCICPECGSLLLELSDQFKHQYKYDHVCANIDCGCNCVNKTIHQDFAKAESTLELVDEEEKQMAESVLAEQEEKILDRAVKRVSKLFK